MKNYNVLQILNFIVLVLFSENKKLFTKKLNLVFTLY